MKPDGWTSWNSCTTHGSSITSKSRQRMTDSLTLTSDRSASKQWSRLFGQSFKRGTRSASNSCASFSILHLSNPMTTSGMSWESAMTSTISSHNVVKSSLHPLLCAPVDQTFALSIQQDLPPDHNEDRRWRLVLLSRYRIQECDRHYQGRPTTWRTPRRTNPSVPQPICAMGQAIQRYPGRTIDSPRTTTHGPCIQRSSTHESWSHDQRVWPNGGEWKHSLLRGDCGMVSGQQLWLGTVSSWLWKVPIGEIMSRTKGDCNGKHGASCLQGLAGGYRQRGQHPVLWQVRRGCCKTWITQWSPQP